MRVLIMAGEAAFGRTLADLVKVQTGAAEDDCLFGIDCTPDTGLAIQLDEIQSSCLKRSECLSFVILADSPFSSAYGQAAQWAQSCGCDCLLMGGVNVPMASDAWYLKDQVDSLEELQKSLTAEGRQSILGSVISF